MNLCKQVVVFVFQMQLLFFQIVCVFFKLYKEWFDNKSQHKAYLYKILVIESFFPLIKWRNYSFD